MSKVTVVVLAAIVSGCAATPINLGAERVRITNAEPGKECKFLGDVTGSQGNFLTGPWTSNENLETGARNDIKNKAAAMGGNVVAILTHWAGQTGSYGQYGWSSQQTNVVITGNVYRCPDTTSLHDDRDGRQRGRSEGVARSTAPADRRQG
jgi:hypothetical protein